MQSMIRSHHACRQIILASTSPRRRDLLTLLGVPFDVIPPTCLENLEADCTPSDHVRRLSMEKALSVAEQYPSSWVLGSDTVIEIDDKILGKPEDLEEAAQMLVQLRGRRHYVHTGIALVCYETDFQESLVESVFIWMKPFSNSQLYQYLDTQESLGKAGAYCIQGEGASLIEKIEGDYPTVVGLPLKRVVECFIKQHIRLPKAIDAIYAEAPYANWKRFQEKKQCAS